MEDDDELQLAGVPEDPPELESIYQDEITLLDEVILAVLGADNEAYIPIRPFCVRLGLAKPERQLERIRGDETLFEASHNMIVESSGGPQKMRCLRADMLVLWLTNIRESQVKASVRPKLKWFKREAARAIISHFRQITLAAQNTHALVPSESIEMPLSPAPDAPTPERISYYDAMIRFYEQQREMELWRQGTDARLDQHEVSLASHEVRIDNVERLAQLIPSIQAQMQENPLSDAHRATIKAMVHRFSDLTGRTVNSIWAEFNFAFHVPEYKRIPESRWHDAFAYLAKRIHNEGGKTDDLREQKSLFEP